MPHLYLTWPVTICHPAWIYTVASVCVEAETSKSFLHVGWRHKDYNHEWLPKPLRNLQYNYIYILARYIRVYLTLPGQYVPYICTYMQQPWLVVPLNCHQYMPLMSSKRWGSCSCLWLFNFGEVLHSSWLLNVSPWPWRYLTDSGRMHVSCTYSHIYIPYYT